ncbi:MAG: serine/threonine-protein kinase, partial [Planctomycetota bacterium]
AVKLLDPELHDDPEQVRAFEREAGVGLGVRHPSLCAIHDLGSGTLEGQPVRYLVRAFQPGQNLRDLVGLPSTDGFLRRVALGIADALAELHGRGLLHRDLKPENVFVDDEGQPIVTDFGLSAFAQGGQTQAAKRFDGTLIYAAPEWFVPGATIGPEADLYALGLVLYELATGKHPRPIDWVFSGAAVDARFPPPSMLNRSLSYFMDQVILQLLDPEPERRLRPAELLLRVLREGESSDWWRKWTRASAEQVRSGKRAFFVDRRTRFVGREPELLDLRERVRRSLPEQRGGVVLLLGEAGLGKTRLLDEVLESLDAEGLSALILISRGVNVSVSLPFYPLGEMIETAFGLKGLSAAQMAPLLKDQLREVLGMPDAIAAEAASFLMGRESKSFADERAAKLYTHLLGAIAQRTQTILVLEGLQWVDPGTIAVLRSFLTLLPTLPMMLFLTARESELERDALRLAREIESRDARSTVRLRSLGADAIATILADLAVAEQHRPALAAAAHGNPLFVLQAEQLLAHERAAGGPGLAMPLDLLEVYRRVVVRLTPAERRYVEAAAVLGARFRPEAVQAVLRLRPLEADEVLRRLLHVHRVFMAEERALRFERPGLQTVILEALEPHTASSCIARWPPTIGSSHRR